MKREKCAKAGCKEKPVYLVIDMGVHFKLCEIHQNAFPRGKKTKLEPPK